MNSLNAQPQTIAVTDYLDYFGLQGDPFSADLLPFYDGGSRRELFAELLHLCQFSPSTLVVLGQPGVGTASLKAALFEHFADQDKVCEFDAPLLCATELILTAITQQLAIDESLQLGTDLDDSGVGQAIANIRQAVHDSEDDDSLKVVMIENAHNLDQASLDALLRLSAPGDQNPYRQLHLVLFADPIFVDRIEKIEDQQRIQLFHLPPISKTEMKHYLRFRLDAVGFSGIFPFKNRDIRFLWDISQGVPGKFHDAAREILIELAMPPPENRSLGMPATHMAAVVLLLAGLLMVFLFQGGSDDETLAADNISQPGQAQSEQAQSEQAQSEQAQSEQLISGAETEEIVLAGESDVVVNAEQIRLEVASNLTAIPDGNVDNNTDNYADKNGVKNNDNQNDSAQPAVQQSNTTVQRDALQRDTQELDSRKSVAQENREIDQNIEALLEAAKEELAEELPSKPASAADNKPNVEANNVTSSLTDDESELLNRAPDNFTLQILASGSKGAVDDFVSRQPNRRDLAVFNAQRNNQTLYIVVMGSFPSSTAARSAVAALPEEQRQGGPWPRSFQSVQAEIRQFRGF